MNYDFKNIEGKWKKFWKEKEAFKASNSSDKPKYYVLDMFPYPSGAGLHVGHPLGYIASDIIARYKRLKGFNVLHPMGYDSFGLPAEQYAIQTGQHPAITTEENTGRYREQLDDLGFSFDWSREVKTSDPSYYKWTQWIFIQLFNSWYDNDLDKARPIQELVSCFEKEGNSRVNASTEYDGVFTASDWKNLNESDRMEVLQHYRLTFLSDSVVNWCPDLGTVLANDEVKDGVSERGGYPVVQKKMKQWSMRITAYADRLLKDLDRVDWSDSIKDQQKNWIGKSIGAKVMFEVKDHNQRLEIFTTRPDTIFGATFMVLAPEHEYVDELTTEACRAEVEVYREKSSKRSERDRMSDVKSISGCFTGSYAIHPFSKKQLPIWIADYVLAGYGTGAVMAVPSGDQRDFNFARKFELEIIPVIEGTDIEVEANEGKEGRMINSEFLNGLPVSEAIDLAIERLNEMEIGEKRVNYRLRDAVFSRQRYWGEPIPVYYKEGVAYPLNETELPLELPEVDKYLPTESGDPPLARAENWKTKDGYPLETNTMPGWAGSSWYMYRYMDAGNTDDLFSQSAVDYWQNVDLYIGGSEHATGHLLYARFWTKFLYDIGKIPVREPFKKMINQGMIYYNSSYIQVNKAKKLIFDSGDINTLEIGHNDSLPSDVKARYQQVAELLKENEIELSDIRESLVPLSMVEKSKDDAGNDIGLIDIEKLSAYSPEFSDYSGYKVVRTAVSNRKDNLVEVQMVADKMSKSKLNVVNPDDIVDRYGADTFRCYEMFMGPLEQAKPWKDDGIDGVFRFLRKFWRLFHHEDDFIVSDQKPDSTELKVLHKTIKKVTEDIERHSFNTVVSEMMICTNELNDLKCNKKLVLEPLVVLLAPYAPFIAEELWEKLGHKKGISYAKYPKYEEKYLIENSHNYPISFNGKMRFTVELPLSLNKDELQAEVLAMDETKKWLEGKEPKKVIVVPNKIVNIVV